MKDYIEADPRHQAVKDFIKQQKSKRSQMPKEEEEEQGNTLSLTLTDNHFNMIKQELMKDIVIDKQEYVESIVKEVKEQVFEYGFLDNLKRQIYKHIEQEMRVMMDDYLDKPDMKEAILRKINQLDIKHLALGIAEDYNRKLIDTYSDQLKRTKDIVYSCEKEIQHFTQRNGISVDEEDHFRKVLVKIAHNYTPSKKLLK